MIQYVGAWIVFPTSCSGNGIRKPAISLVGCVFGILAAVIVLSCGKTEARTVRVGVYDNPPKVEMGDAGTPRGIFIDIIENIAKREGWSIKYVYGTWDTGLKRLENDSIDIMPDVAFSDIRNKRFDFNKLTVLCSWLQVFCKKDIVIESISALEGKTVAVLEGSIQRQVCDKIRERFGLSFNLIELPDYEGTIKEVESGKADAVIVSRFYAYRNGKEGALVPTAVILHPSTLHFAAPKGRSRDLLDAIDKHLAEMMNDPHSVYYKALAYWIYEKPRMFIPGFVVWCIVSITIALMVFFALSLVLRWQVRKRTKELGEKNNDLLAALEKLKAAQDASIKRERLYAFGQLASGIAHDFNNLLIPILNYTEMLLVDETELDNKKNALLKLRAIKSAAQHGAELIQRMQKFYRSTRHPESGNLIDTNSIIQEVVELTKIRLRRVLSGKAIEVTLNLGKNTEITGSGSDLHEILLNLVLNAADAMPEDGRLEISTERIDGAVTITVKDYGIGMTDEIREKCLNPFFTTKGESGTGMGLTMVNNIVAAHDGHLKIVSSIGAGTSFIMTFPGARDEQRHAPGTDA
ncbi:MAG: transporter substrate-binding domain-containing protein [Chitinispirillaceae bacterium]|nr:transporter substrate-binding domain-containing protein [Chitinispirillaceae bacterium]